MGLSGKVALVTGAGQRLGREIALALGRGGADVFVHYGSSAAGAEATASTLRQLGREAWEVEADLADVEQIGRLFDTVRGRTGRLDVLVNSAAVFEKQPFADVEVEDWERTMSVNLRAPFFCSQRAAALMGSAEGSGVIINVSDLSGRLALAGILGARHEQGRSDLSYRISGSGAWAESAGQRRGARPILPPPGVATDDPEWLRRGDRLPLARTGSPEHIAKAVLALIENDYITGAVLPVDGGERLVGLR